MDNKGAITVQWGEVVSQQMGPDQLYIHVLKKPCLHLTIHVKITLTWIRDLNVKDFKKKFLEFKTQKETIFMTMEWTKIF